jgi:hypothetical protein
VVVAPVTGVGAPLAGVATLMPPPAVGAAAAPVEVQEVDCVCPGAAAGAVGVLEFGVADAADAMGVADATGAALATGTYVPVSPTPRGPCPATRADAPVLAGVAVAVARHRLLLGVTELVPAVLAAA